MKLIREKKLSTMKINFKNKKRRLEVKGYIKKFFRITT